MVPVTVIFFRESHLVNAFVKAVPDDTSDVLEKASSVTVSKALALLKIYLADSGVFVKSIFGTFVIAEYAIQL